MEELKKWETINQAQTYEQLAEAIKKIADENNEIEGSRNIMYDADKQAEIALNFDNYIPNNLTRSYGIRQQAFYIQYYS